MTSELTIWLILAALGTGILLVLFGIVDFVRMFGPRVNEIPGMRGVVLEWRDEAGYVMVDGERWRARGRAGLEPGEEVVVRSLEGLVVNVAPRRRRWFSRGR